MKNTGGLLKRSSEEIARDHAELRAEGVILDSCAHRLVRHPERSEAIVITSMKGELGVTKAQGEDGATRVKRREGRRFGAIIVT